MSASLLLASDGPELLRLQSLTSSPRVRDALQNLLASLPSSDEGGDVDAEDAKMADDPVALAPAATLAPAPAPAPAPAGSVPSYALSEAGTVYKTISTYAFDAGEYNSPCVTLYVSLAGVGACKKGVTCEFGETTGFDLIVRGWEGGTWRLKKDNLAHNIVVEKR